MSIFKGTARRLESLEISKIAASIGCGEDHIHAVLEVETRGGGFDRHGRVKILFEPHVFYRELGPGAKRDAAVAAGLAYRNWGEKKYPLDSYPRLQKAREIDDVAALRSCSYGLGQTMGFNHEVCGFSSAADMIKAYAASEAKQLAGMVQFIIGTGLDDDLRREDWSGFARGYNGSGYKRHGYHTKLRKAFAKWRRIPDTPFTPDDIDRAEFDPNPAPVPTTDRRTLQLGDRGADVGILQIDLAELRYFSGKVDKIFGPLVNASVLAFQSDNGLDPDGIAGPLFWDAMKTAPPRPLRGITEADLDDSGTLEDTRRSDRIADLSALGGIGKIASDAQEQAAEVQNAVAGAQSAADSALNLWEQVQPYWPIALIAVAYLIWRGINHTTRQRRVRDADMGGNLAR